MMDRSASGRLGAVAGLTFAVLEVARNALVPPPPLDGSTAEVAAWVTRNVGVLRVFPWFDAVAAAGFAIFGIILAGRLRSTQDDVLVTIGTAAAALVFGVSLILDASIVAITGSTIGASQAVAPVLLIAGAGVEAMFPYPLALFLGAVGWLMVARGSSVLGWAAWAIGAAFLASGLLPALDLDLEIEGPLFMALLVWIVIASIGMVRDQREMPSVRASAPA